MAKIYLFWDPLEDNVVREYDEAGTVTAEYTTEPGLYGNVISQRRQGEYRQFHYDGQGSTLAATDENENVTDTFAYTAFGEVTERTGTSLIPFQYIGRNGYYRNSLTGQYLVRRRPIYSPYGRWMCPDPIAFASEHANVYLYCNNSVLMCADPSGLKCRVLGGGRNVRGAKFADLDTMLRPPIDSFTRAMDIFLQGVYGRPKYKPNEPLTGTNIPDLDTTGPGIIRNKATKALPAGSYAIAYWPFFWWFYACQDNDGDCEIAVFETWKEETTDANGKWQVVTAVDRKSRHVAIKRQSLTFGLTKNFGIPPAAEDRCCDLSKSKVIVLADLPNFDAALKDIGALGAKASGRRLSVMQEVVIYESGSDAPVGGGEWEFSLEIDLAGNLTANP